jgi:transposase
MKELVQRLFSGTEYLSHKLEGDELVLELESVQEESSCPYCNLSSDKVHSRYQRKFSDLPIKGYPTTVILHCRKFFCRNQECKHQTFTESFDFIEPLESKTERLIFEILRISENNSSRKASAILADMGIKTSRATICNLKNKKIS